MAFAKCESVGNRCTRGAMMSRKAMNDSCDDCIVSSSERALHRHRLDAREGRYRPSDWLAQPSRVSVCQIANVTFRATFAHSRSYVLTTNDRRSTTLVSGTYTELQNLRMEHTRGTYSWLTNYTIASGRACKYNTYSRTPAHRSHRLQQRTRGWNQV